MVFGFSKEDLVLLASFFFFFAARDRRGSYQIVCAQACFVFSCPALCFHVLFCIFLLISYFYVLFLILLS